MSDTAFRRLTLEEFLVWDDGTDTRYELIDGVPVAMAPTAETHGMLTVALGAELRRQLRPPCRVVGEAGVVSGGKRGTYFQADIAVSCAPRSSTQSWPADPLVLI